MRRNHFILGLVGLCLAGCGDGSSTPKKTSESTDGGKKKTAASDAGAATSKLKPVDRSGLTDVGSDPLDYENPNYWMCRPDIDPNACHVNLDATEIASDGSRKLVKFERATDPKFDCFYVYPTVLLDGSRPTMTDFSKTDIVLDPLLSQAATFTQVCEVYAPLYRQNGLNASAAGVMVAAGSNPQLGLKDVTDAFHYFLDHIAKDRKFVIMGHSQGTGVLTQMMKTEVDTKPEVLARMISALLIGGGVLVPEGQHMGTPGSFVNIPTCSQPGEVGCVIAYHSFAKENPPGANAIGGTPPAGLQAACTEPAALAGNGGRYRGSYVAMNPVNPTFKADGAAPTGIDTPFIVYRDLFRGQCTKAGAIDYLEISLEQDPGDMRMPMYRFTAGAEVIGFGLHIVDYNLVLDDLIDAVRKQADAALQ